MSAAVGQGSLPSGLLVGFGPLSDSRRPVVEPCPLGRCDHPAVYHDRRILGGIKGDRIACTLCLVEGGRCA